MLTYADGVTSTVTYVYDKATNGKGYLRSVTNGNSVTNYTSYDALGDVAASSQQTAGQTYSFSYAYNLAGALTSETYPSGRVVTTAYDTVNQESGVTGTFGGQPTNYVGTVSYWPHGAAEKYWLANQIVKTYVFTPQLQIGGDWDARYDNGNYFSFIESPITYNTLGSGSNNNGNVQSIALWEGPSFQQSFVYDGLNRLTNASDSGGWSRGFGYDQWGNMWVSSNVNLPLAGNTPTSSGAFNTKNQLNGTNYDGAGNALSVNGNTMAYDAEERQMSATEPPALGGATEYYYYDGNGQRIEKYGPSGPTMYVYDALGQLAAEYTGSAQRNPPCTTCYLGYDHLGSVRVVTDQNANVIARHDYLPFGEEIPSGWAYRNSQFGAVGNVAQRFTGQIRDSESGEDFFNARYFVGALGRFNGADPANAGAQPVNPQSWNGYGYVFGNPVRLVDPTGLGSVDCGLAGRGSLCGGGQGINSVSIDGAPGISGALSGELLGGGESYARCPGNICSVQTSLGLYEFNSYPNGLSGYVPFGQQPYEIQESMFGKTFTSYGNIILSELRTFPTQLSFFIPVATVVIPVGDLPVPIASVGLSPSLTIRPKSRQVCAGLGIGLATPGHSVNATLLNVGSRDAATHDSVASGWGWNFNGQTNWVAGFTYANSGSNNAGGFSFGTPGLGASYGYSSLACWSW